MGSLQEESQGEKVIEELLNALLGLMDGTNDNDEETMTKLKMIEIDKIKKIKRV